ncbi:MAG: hypothetical protein FWE06_01615 [Oscillospiraceae bacterium]|nr:hypothetical protein [Oscillospiraceae bacterium]
MHQRELISGERWIIDGNYGSTIELRFAAAEVVIFLDINRFVCMLSVAKRVGKKRSDLPEYLKERGVFSKEFLTFCKWIWEYPKTKKKTVMALHKKYSDKPFLRVKTRREVRSLLAQWGAF